MCLLKFLFDEEISPHSVRAPVATPSKLASMDGKYSKLRRFFFGGCRLMSPANKYGRFLSKGYARWCQDWSKQKLMWHTKKEYQYMYKWGVFFCTSLKRSYLTIFNHSNPTLGYSASMLGCLWYQYLYGHHGTGLGPPFFTLGLEVDCQLANRDSSSWGSSLDWKIRDSYNPIGSMYGIFTYICLIFIWFLWYKCREIHHTWMLWEWEVCWMF